MIDGTLQNNWDSNFCKNSQIFKFGISAEFPKHIERDRFLWKFPQQSCNSTMIFGQ